MEYADSKSATLRWISPAARAPPEITRNIPGHEIVAQRVHGHPLVDLCHRGGIMDGTLPVILSKEEVTRLM
jgi:hypothetical protein